MLRLNLGAADRHVDGYLSVDRSYARCHYETDGDGNIVGHGEWAADISGQWSWWNDSSIEEILAFDIVEHLPNRINTMNEIHRVLRPGGIARIETPNAARGAGYFQDPTHVAPWCMNSFQYFEHESFAHRRFARAYGITAAFRVLQLTESMWQEKYEETWKITAVLEAIK